MEDIMYDYHQFSGQVSGDGKTDGLIEVVNGYMELLRDWENVHFEIDYKFCVNGRKKENS